MSLVQSIHLALEDSFLGPKSGSYAYLHKRLLQPGSREGTMDAVMKGREYIQRKVDR